MAPKEANYELLRTLDRVSQDLGLGPVRALDPGRRGAGDVSFVADQVAVLDGLGAQASIRTRRGIHRAGFPRAPDPAAALLIYRLTR